MTTPQLNDIAKKVVLHYFQNNNAPGDRVAALNAAVAAAGIQAVFSQNADGSDSGWTADVEAEADRAIAFRHDLEGCFPLGQVEAEIAAVARVIVQHTKGLPR